MRERDRQQIPGLKILQICGATILSAIVLVAVELVWLASSARELMLGTWVRATFSHFGHSVSSLVLIAAGWWFSSLLVCRFSLRASRAAALSSLLLGPYFFVLARFTFSGPQVRDLSYQPVVVVVGLVALMTGAWGLLWLFFVRLGRRGSVALSVAQSLSAVLVLWFGASFLRNEYEPLHAFLVLFALSILWWGALEAVRAFGIFSSTSKRGVFALAGGLAVVVLGAQISLAGSRSIHWLVFGESAAARYVALDPVEFLSSLGSEEELELSSPSLDWRTTAEKPVVSDRRAAAGERALRREKKAPHLVVFSIDNLQSDRLGTNGYRVHPSTPNIDRLAAKGANFRRAYAHYPGTRVFLSSMLVGRRLPSFKSHQMPKPFVETALTRLLKKRDYHILVKGVFELTAARAFDPKSYAIDTYLRRATSAEIRASGTIPHIPLKERFRQIENHLHQAKTRDLPAFLWLHMLKPHRWRGKFVGSEKFDWGNDIDSLYDASVAATDALIPRIEALMDEYFSGSRDVLWVIMSDHGAGLTRGSKKEVGKTLYEDQVNVPLILSGPGISPSTHEMLVDSCLDVSATLLDWVGIAPPAHYDGVSLVPVLTRSVHPDAFDDRLIALRSGSWTGAVYQDHKLIRRKRSTSLFRLTDDPLERKNRADDDRRLLRTMQRRAGTELGRSKKLYREGLKQRSQR